MICSETGSGFKNMFTMEHNNRSIKFRFTRSEQNNKPILFILHGHGHSGEPSNFQSPNWNVVCPMDSYGYDGLGSWYLGENGDMFWISAITALVEWVKNVTGTGRIYFWGSSMGGYASIVHGRLNNATSVYANVPQTVLLDSSYSNNGMKKYFEPIFGDTVNNNYNDLKSLFTERTRTTYFLCFNQLEGGNYFEEQCLRFATHLTQLKQKLYLEVRPTSSHGKNHGISESINLFKRYANV